MKHTQFEVQEESLPNPILWLQAHVFLISSRARLNILRLVPTTLDSLSIVGHTHFLEPTLILIMRISVGYNNSNPHAISSL